MFEEDHTVHIGRSTPAASTPASQGPDWMPGKFHVSSDAGFDLEASARKMVDSYSQLESRVGTGNMRPESADLYTYKLPEEMAEGFEETDVLKGFRAKAHELGLTQEQFDGVMGSYFDMAPRLARGAFDVDREMAESELRQHWPSDREMQRGMDGAFRAFKAFADPSDMARVDQIGNSPVVIRLLYNLSKELGEDAGIPASAGGGSGGAAPANVKELLTSEAASNPGHPRHKEVRAQIDAHYLRLHGTAQAQFQR